MAPSSDEEAYDAYYKVMNAIDKFLEATGTVTADGFCKHVVDMWNMCRALRHKLHKHPVYAVAMKEAVRHLRPFVDYIGDYGSDIDDYLVVSGMLTAYEMAAARV